MIKTIKSRRQSSGSLSMAQSFILKKKKTEAVSAFARSEQLSLAFFDNQDQLGGLIGNVQGIRSIFNYWQSIQTIKIKE